MSNVVYSGYKPGALASILKLHVHYYHQQWNFGLPFEVNVASGLAEFLSRMNVNRDLFECAYNQDGALIGSIIIDAAGTDIGDAHLRWFIDSQEYAGHGIGRELMSRAISHCDNLGYNSIFLNTFNGLDAARSLYEQFNFRLVKEEANDQWKGGVTQQTFVRRFKGT